MSDAMAHYAAWAVFAWVFVNQAGVPVPVVPSLVAAGALAANGGPRISVTLLAAVAAALCADIVWYGVGRWRGAQVLGLLRRISHAPDTCADRAENLFLAHEVGFQFWARFLPELNAVVAGLAGATRVALGRYVVVAIASAIAWAGVWAIAGYLLCDVLRRVTVLLGAVTIGAVAFVLVVVAVVAWVVIRSMRRRRASDNRRRAAVLLRDLDGLSHQQIGDALGLTIGSIKMCLHRGRLFLRKRLERLGVTPEREHVA